MILSIDRHTDYLPLLNVSAKIMNKENKTKMNSNSPLMQIWLPLAVAAIIQASFSLGLSVFTLLSGSMLSRKGVANKSGLLASSYILGSLVFTSATLTVCLWMASSFSLDQNLTWFILAISSIMVGFLVILFYYRNDSGGTRLWLPRAIAKYIYNKTKHASSLGVSFTLGAQVVFFELVLVIVPIFVGAVVLSEADGPNRYLGIVVYSLATVLPLITLALAYRHGNKVGSVQRWRENNKRFMQVMAGSLMVILGVYLLAYKFTGGII